MAIVKKLLHLSERIVAWIWLSLHGVEVEGLPHCKGLPRIRNEGSMRIESDARINSRMSANPIGGMNRVILVTGPGAEIVIESGAALSNSAIVAHERVTVGQYSYIGGDCRVYDTDFHPLDPNVRLQNPRDRGRTAPVLIGERSFIGAGSVILKGVRIGRESVVGAYAVVRHDIPEKQVWAGNPAVMVRNHV